MVEEIKAMLDLLIKSPRAGDQFTLYVRPYDTIASVKAKIRDRNRIPVDLLCLVWNGRVLDDQRTLSDYKIQSEAILHLIVRM